MSGKWAVVEVQELHLCITLHLLLRTLNLSRLDLDLCKAICWRKYCQRYNRPRRWQVKTGKKWPNFKRPEDPLNLVQIKNPFGSFQCDPQAYAWWVPPFFWMKILNFGTPYPTCWIYRFAYVIWAVKNIKYHTGKYLAVPFHPGSAISRGRPTMSCMSMLKAMCSKPTCTNWYVKNRHTCNLIINWKHHRPAAPPLV